MKETQGSVEVTSYGQMRNILKYGCYEVGSTVQSKQVHDVHDLISLKLSIKDKQLNKTSYSLDELRDLESKLVLITGSKAENRTEVDHYLNVCACIINFYILICYCHPLLQVLQHVTRIAEVLLALRQAGNVAFSGRVVMIRCAMYAGEDSEKEPQFVEDLAAQHVAELSTIAKEMENTLEEWENEVKKSRRCYYELNYYTTLQLLRLRKELGLVRNNHHSKVDPEVLALLHSISQEINSENVFRVVNELEKRRLDLHTAAKLVQEDVNDEASEVHSSTPLTTKENSIPGNNSQMQTVEESLEALKDTKPQLTEEDLTNNQREILADLVEYQGYSKRLVLKAFEECHESSNTYDIQAWCIQNEGQNFDEDEKDDEAVSSNSGSSGSDSSDEEDGNIFTPHFQQGYLSMYSVHFHMTTVKNILPLRYSP